VSLIRSRGNVYVGYTTHSLEDLWVVMAEIGGGVFSKAADHRFTPLHPHHGKGRKGAIVL